MRQKSRGRMFFDALAVVTLVVFGLYATLITLGTILIPQIRDKS